MQSFKRTRPCVIRHFPRGCGKLAITADESSENENENHFQHPTIKDKLDVFPYSREDSSSAFDSITSVNTKFVVENNEMAANGDVRAFASTTTSRNEVQEVLKLYRQILKKVENDAKSKPGKSNNVHEDAAMLLRSSYKWLNIEKRLGSVPGVEIGDKFQFRAELNITGLHRQFAKGIDYMKKDGIILATSIVATTRYDNHMSSSDVLIYHGEGGNPNVRNQHPLKDQVLEQGNLALNNSMEARTPVRVIRSKVCKRSKLLNPRQKALGTTTAYYYDGLYVVEKWWQERGEFGKLVFKFQLRRIGGQHRASLAKSKNCTSSRLMNDISVGKEKIPIAVVNTIDNERPLPFTYIANISYNGVQGLSLSRGCDCIDGCLNSEDCSCKAKNGQEFAYDDCKRIVRRKPCIYECGPFCKCSESCNNRVSQLGIQFQLEVFKTESKGWGVRSRSYIRAGSFICEYIGKICQAKEAEQRFGRDEHLFDVGDTYDDHMFRDNHVPRLCNSEHSSLSKKDGGFTIDAARCGNVGRFINHSCSANLYVQNVLYDHHDSRMPHIMLFAKEDIPPFKELTYDYNYRVGKLPFVNGNVKAKNCMCKSSKCVGKFY